MTPTLGETENLVRRLFKDVADRGGRPYAEHCLRVLWRAAYDDEDMPMDEQHAAVLHDVIEDTPTTSDDLRARGYTGRTVWLVQKLTKWKGADYAAYVESIVATGDRGLIAIKRADLADNSDPARLALLPDTDRKRLAAKYAAAREILEAVR
jgi:(p)ppGpp synthase/HD superfamily hydrolase